jgi:hypothetical protein
VSPASSVEAHDALSRRPSYGSAMSGTRARGRTAIVVLALACVTACGSTVQQQSTLAGPGAPAVADANSDGIPDAPAAGLEPPGVAAGEAAPGGDGSVPDAAAPEADAAGVPAAPGTGADAPPAAAPARAAPPAGAAADRSPLRIGLLYVNNDAAAGAGVDNGNSFGPRRVLEALVKSTNDGGGLAGRRLQPTWFELKSSSSSYASDLQAACARFVEDAKTPLVLSFLGTSSEQFSSCLAKAGVAHVNGSYGLGDTTSMASQPTTVSIPALSVDRRSRAQLEQLTAAGHLTRASRLGVIVEGCPYNVRGVERTLLPTAKRLGLNVVQQQEVRCFGGINDLGGLASDAQNAVLRFAADDVDRVLVVSSVEANVLLVFTNAAESQGYRPGYALTSLALANVLKDNVPQQQLVGAKGVGWLPAMDDAGPTLAPTPQTKACVQRVRAQGVSPSGIVDHFTVFSSCDAFDLAGQVLTRSRGAVGPAAWSKALDAVGRSFRGATTLEGQTDFSGGRRDGPARMRTFGWDAKCSCFRYAGATAPV